MVKAFVIGLAAGLLAACSGSSSEPAAATTPTIDPVAVKYVALTHSFWAAYVSAEYVSAGKNAGDVCIVNVDMRACAARGQAMIPVLQKFLADLDTTPAPAKFAADDSNIRRQLPTRSLT